MGWRRLAGHWLLSDYDLALDLGRRRSEEHTSELQSRLHLVCRLLLEKKKTYINTGVYRHLLNHDLERDTHVFSSYHHMTLAIYSVYVHQTLSMTDISTRTTTL